MKVRTLTHTPNPENIVATSARLCYSDSNIDDLFEKYTDEQNAKMIDKLIDYNHDSPVEHISFTFGIEGVSRSLTHQLVRHRIASYSQKSQRYVKENQFEYVIPPEIKKDLNLRNVYQRHIHESQKVYDLLVDGLILNGRTEKQAIEDARYVFPNAYETKIIMTMNARSLLNFFKLRCCNNAQWEIRELADKILIECKKIAPNLFKYAGASCMFSSCPEGSKSCGNPRRLEEYEGNDE